MTLAQAWQAGHSNQTRVREERQHNTLKSKNLSGSQNATDGGNKRR